MPAWAVTSVSCVLETSASTVEKLPCPAPFLSPLTAGHLGEQDEEEEDR